MDKKRESDLRYSIRCLNKEDDKELRSFFSECNRAYGSTQKLGSQLKELRDRIQYRTVEVLAVCNSHDEFVAGGQVDISNFGTPVRLAYIHHAFVTQEYRNQGLSKVLYEMACKLAMHYGATQAFAFADYDKRGPVQALMGAGFKLSNNKTLLQLLDDQKLCQIFAKTLR